MENIWNVISTDLCLTEPPGNIIPGFVPQYKPPFGGVVDSS